MRAIAMVVADRANMTPDGKFDILGVIKQLHAPAFPVRHQSLSLAIMLEKEDTDTADAHDMRVDIVSADGSVTVSSTTGHLGYEQVEDESDLALPPLTMVAQNLVFPAPGVYSFVLYIDGRREARWDISVRQQSPN